MHYKDGQPVELEDVARFPVSIEDKDAEGGRRMVTREGIVILRFTGATGDRCNAQVASPIIVRANGSVDAVPVLVLQTVTVSTDECELVHRKA